MPPQQPPPEPPKKKSSPITTAAAVGFCVIMLILLVGAIAGVSDSSRSKSTPTRNNQARTAPVESAATTKTTAEDTKPETISEKIQAFADCRPANTKQNEFFGYYSQVCTWGSDSFTFWFADSQDTTEVCTFEDIDDDFEPHTLVAVKNPGKEFCAMIPADDDETPLRAFAEAFAAEYSSPKIKLIYWPDKPGGSVDVEIFGTESKPDDPNPSPTP